MTFKRNMFCQYFSVIVFCLKKSSVIFIIKKIFYNLVHT